MDATWTGVMVGTPAQGANQDNILQGDARLTYDMSEQTINAHFSKIVDLDRQAAHSVVDVRFANVRVDRFGRYHNGSNADRISGSVGNLLNGAFFGDDHAETAGVFEKDGIIGAYGAKKQ